MRSKLFVPGSRPDLFAKAFAGPADAVSIDLEDAVAPERKAEARAAVAALLATLAPGTAKTVIVRVNGLDTPHFEADVHAVARPGLALLNVPKLESPSAIRAAVEVLARAERANGIGAPIGLLVNVETPRALRCAAELGGADPRVAGLQLGLADLFEPHGIDRRDPAAVHAALFAVRMAAAEAGVPAYGAAFPEVRDSDGFVAEARRARSLGYRGKTCIHPAQVPLANEVFLPQAGELARAERLLAAVAVARSRGAGAFLLDGQMIDAPMIRRAEAIVDSARDAPAAPK